MMLFKLSLKNIKKSFKDYAIYFFTLILGVAIFYVFNAIDSQTVMMDVTASTKEIIKLMTSMLSGVSVFVSFILGFLIIYASRFLIKRRNKEFGVYLTLGMSKRKISMILFCETLLIGTISLIVGLALGFILSQFMSMLVANMFDANMTQFTFIFSSTACIKTIIYFTIMYLLVMIFNTISIGKCKLIELLHGNKKSEKVKLKNPFLCVIIFFISVVILGYAYYMVTIGFQSLDADNIFKPIILGVISTFLLFFSLSGLILKIVMSRKRLYYKGLNSFVIRQISSKMNTTVFSMTIICLMLFITICVLSSSLTLKNSLQANVNKLAPADIQLTKRVNIKEPPTEDGYTLEQIKNSKLGVIDSLKERNVHIDTYFKESVDVNIYHTESFTLGDTLGNLLKSIQKQYKFLKYDSKEDIMKISDYNLVARLYGNKEYFLKENEYMIVADFQSMITVRNMALKNNEKIKIFGHTLTPKYQECKEGFVELSAQHINGGIVLVPDEVVLENDKVYNMVIANYKADTKKKRVEVEEEILKQVEDSQNQTLLFNNTRIDIMEASVGLGALVTFIGLYLGIIFLISSAAILALKELSESSDNRERYRMLRKIGADEKLLHSSLFRQIAIFFMFPLLLAMIHSVFGLIFSTKILEVFGNDQLLPSIFMTAIFLVVIYGGYFLITYFCSKNIIKERS